MPRLVDTRPPQASASARIAGAGIAGARIPDVRIAGARILSRTRMRAGMRSRVTWAICAFLFLPEGTTPPIACAQTRFQAEPVLTFVGPANNPLYLPTAVAVAPDGRVFVVDGANDRLIEFGPDGSWIGEIRKIGDETLSKPISARADGADRLWVADTGRGRVLVRSPDGALERVLDPGGPENDGRVDITDIAVSSDGTRAWLVDNNRHRLLRFEVATGLWTSVGSQGDQHGQFHYPFMIALGAKDDVFVTDVLNARVATLAPEGTPRPSLGQLGAEAGQLYRPKGIALDAGGNVWVADGTLTVVQVFTPAGLLLDIVRDDAGQPLRLETPTGIVLDSKGDLYVVEMAAHRVRKFRITCHEKSGNPTMPSPHPSATTQRRDCLYCHFEWLPAFTGGTRSSLMGRPADSPEHPYVSRSESCLSCHDGSVVDSRHTVWREHGHGSGIRPPETMSVSADWPLPKGEIACRTCHAAHQRPDTGNILRDAVFLRVQSGAHELCVRCHAGMSGGPTSGMHSLGTMNVPVPDELLGPKGHANTRSAEITCLTCHHAHGTGKESLLVVNTTTNRLCLSCHERIDAQLFEEPSSFDHPLEKRLVPGQLSALRSLGTTIGTGNKLVCSSCHKTHGAEPGRYLLADSMPDSGLCLQCHADQREALGSPHDFTKRAQNFNARGQSATEAGTCGFCHATHGALGPALWIVTSSSPPSPEGLCLSCHQTGSVLATTPVRQVLHPEGLVTCATCHDVHADGRKSSDLLRTPNETTSGTALCFECHEEAKSVEISLHHPANMRRFAHGDEFCGPCHVVHAPPGVTATAGMWMAPTNATDKDAASRYCTGCHGGGGGARSIVMREHPALPMCNPQEPDSSGFMPLSNGAGAVCGRIDCNTCHLPHGRSPGGGFEILDAPPAREILRAMKPMIRPYEAPNLCSSCHGLEGLQRFLNYHPPARTVEPAKPLNP